VNFIKQIYSMDVVAQEARGLISAHMEDHQSVWNYLGGGEGGEAWPKKAISFSFGGQCIM